MRTVCALCSVCVAHHDAFSHLVALFACSRLFTHTTFFFALSFHQLQVQSPRLCGVHPRLRPQRCGARFRRQDAEGRARCARVVHVFVSFTSELTAARHACLQVCKSCCCSSIASVTRSCRRRRASARRCVRTRCRRAYCVLLPCLTFSFFLSFCFFADPPPRQQGPKGPAAGGQRLRGRVHCVGPAVAPACTVEAAQCQGQVRFHFSFFVDTFLVFCFFPRVWVVRAAIHQ